jgi:glycosyltransferase 2 family protein
VKRPSLGGLIRVAVAAGLTGFVLWTSRPSEVVAAARDADLAPLLLAIGLVIVDRALMAWRWFWLLQAFPATQHARFTDLLRLFFVSTFVGTFLPASVGGDAVRAAGLARMRVPLADAVASVFMDRVLGVLSILAMAVLGLWLGRGQLPAGRFVLLSLLFCAAGCAAVALVIFSSRAATLVKRSLGLLQVQRVARVGRSVIDAVQRYADRHGLLAGVLAASIGVQVLRIVQAYCLGLSLNLGAGPVSYFAFVPVILLVMLLPITINGIGTSQAAFVLFFTQAGVSSAGAFALSVLFVALGIVGNLPGGILYAWDGLGPKTADPVTK